MCVLPVHSHLIMKNKKKQKYVWVELLQRRVFEIFEVKFSRWRWFSEIPEYLPQRCTFSWYSLWYKIVGRPYQLDRVTIYFSLNSAVFEFFFSMGLLQSRKYLDIFLFIWKPWVDHLSFIWGVLFQDFTSTPRCSNGGECLMQTYYFSGIFQISGIANLQHSIQGSN